MRKAEELKNDVVELATPEGRLIGSAGHDNAKRWVIDRMCEMELSPYMDASFELPYKMNGTEFTNIGFASPRKSEEQKRGKPMESL